jgi:aminoacyl-tRNA hydrolase
VSKIRRLADTYCKNHHLNENAAKPDGLYKTWENVKYGVWNNQKVKQVDFCEKRTVVTLSAAHWERGNLNSDVCLRDSAGNLYKMLHNESSGNRYIDYIRGARYAFEPLPKGVTHFDIVQKVSKKVSFTNENGESYIIAKPYTYMNLSGDSIRLVKDFYKIDIEDMLIICDDLDMEVGKIRFRTKGSAGGHNGLKSIIANLGTETFNRIKVGISRDRNIPVPDWVLSRFKDEDKIKADSAFEHVASCLYNYLTENQTVQELGTALSQHK